ncbi:hypothetical protein FRX31_009034 [Thalictrum thalictroides]|uniref:Uncharacterized protein n=1 Tax=Thalictrum thalictroides TaxID=46969 RepID=A0A7J6WWG6_THATH|nr:hypothetical protein FRX31_009034 [Thalictrum thalictroides]
MGSTPRGTAFRFPEKWGSILGTVLGNEIQKSGGGDSLHYASQQVRIDRDGINWDLGLDLCWIWEEMKNREVHKVGSKIGFLRMVIDFRLQRCVVKDNTKGKGGIQGRK